MEEWGIGGANKEQRTENREQRIQNGVLIRVVASPLGGSWPFVVHRAFVFHRMTRMVWMGLQDFAGGRNHPQMIHLPLRMSRS